jgi:DNA polymerase-3 subunit epsilon
MILIHILFLAVARMAQAVRACLPSPYLNYTAIPGMGHNAGGTVLDQVMQQEFVVVELISSGRNHPQAGIVEIAAILVKPGFAPLSTFNVLVRTAQPIAEKISRRSGLTQAQLDRDGITLHDALRQLQAFAGQRPLFSCNTPGELHLLGESAARCGLRFDNPFYYGLMVAWTAWPGLPSSRLEDLADLLGLKLEPSRRAMASAETVLAVLRAASLSVSGLQPATRPGAQSVPPPASRKPVV